MGRKPDLLKDQSLLSILKNNARMPLSEIAKQLKVSRATVQSRLSRLEREGYIKGYTIISGVETGDVKVLSAVILVELELRSQAGVINSLKKIPEIVSCHTVNGQFDLLLRVQCSVSSELDEVIDQIAHIEGVKRTTSSLLLARKFER